MPTYGYECLGCARSFETVQKITDDTLTECDQCGGVLKKKVFPVGVVFKGSGFYVNDYAKKGSASTEPTPSTTPSAETLAAPAATAATETVAPSAATNESKPADTKPAPAAPATPAKST